MVKAGTATSSIKRKFLTIRLTMTVGIGLDSLRRRRFPVGYVHCTMTSLHQILTPILIPHFPCRISRRKSPSLPRGLRRFYLLSRSDISLGLETRTQKMGWRPWKAKAIGRTAEVNEPEERKLSSLSCSDTGMMTRHIPESGGRSRERGKNSSSSFGKRRRKEEDQKRETPSTGG